MCETIHGGDIYRNSVKLDFSVNINPLGIPKRVKLALHEALSLCSCYPDNRAEALRTAISRMTGAKTEEILCGNGASELFLAMVHAIRPGRTLIPVPSFFGYEKAAAAGSGTVSYYDMKKEHQFCLDKSFLDSLTEEVDLLFLANPNNPVGNQIKLELLEQILERCREKQIFVAVDECFLEFTETEPTQTLIKRTAEFDNVIVIRAFTKIFAIPGVRLGYLICSNRDLIQRINAQLPEWNLSVFAQMAGRVAASETGFIEESREIVRLERQFLREGLQEQGMKLYPGTANYLLFQTELPLYGKLLEQGILIRDCGNYRGLEQGYYRIAVRTRKENEMLIEAVRQIREMDGT